MFGTSWSFRRWLGPRPGTIAMERVPSIATELDPADHSDDQRSVDSRASNQDSIFVNVLSNSCYADDNL